MDKVFKALADGTRRTLLDRLFENNGQTLSELCTHAEMTRQAVTKHLNVLEDAGLVVSEKAGRHKKYFLNAAPIADIYHRWIHKYDEPQVAALTEMKKKLEEEN